MRVPPRLTALILAFGLLATGCSSPKRSPDAPDLAGRDLPDAGPLDVDGGPLPYCDVWSVPEGGMLASETVFEEVLADASFVYDGNDSEDLVEDVGAQPECPDGLTMHDAGVCAPSLPECAPWQRVSASGECLSVGPRACVETDNEEANCIAGQRPCPPGFFPESDGVHCVPDFSMGCGSNMVATLGGGCKAVGPVWTTSDGLEPSWPVCGPGQTHTAQGQCVTVGPRYCADPAQGEVGDCLPGEPFACPEGWEATDDGLACLVQFDECDAWERPIPGGGCEDASQYYSCPEGDFPVAPDDAVDVVYVKADSPACGDSCGTQETPYASLTSALAAVAEGGTVLVGAGNYYGGLRIEKAVHVLGLCPDKTQIVGKISAQGGGGGVLSPSGISIVGVDNVEIGGLSVWPYVDNWWEYLYYPGIVIYGSDNVSLSNVYVGKSAGASISVEYSTGVTLDHVVTREVIPSDQWFLSKVGGYGINVMTWSDVTATNVVVSKASRAGVNVYDGSLTLSDSVIRLTSPFGGSDSGNGLRVDAWGEVVVAGVLLEDNTYAGVYVSGMSTLDAVRMVVRETKSSDQNGPSGGYGVWVNDSSLVTLDQTWIDGNRASGLVATNQGTDVAIKRSVVSGTLPETGYSFSGEGILVTDSAHIEVAESLVESNTLWGIKAVGPVENFSDGEIPTSCEVHRSIVRTTQPDEFGQGGGGIFAEFGASVDLVQTVVEDNLKAGVFVEDSLTTFVANESVLRNSLPNEASGFGVGLACNNGATALLKQSVVEGNRTAGILAYDSPAEVVLEQSIVRNNLVTEDTGLYGFGVYLGDGAMLTSTESVIEGNSSGGVVADGAGSVAALTSTVVRNTLPGLLGYGAGVWLHHGSFGILERCNLSGNSRAGIIVADEGSQAWIGHTLIAQTVPDNWGKGGFGIDMERGAWALVEDTLLSGNTSAGAALFDTGTSVTVDRSRITGTVAAQGAKDGIGLVLSAGSSGLIRRGVIEANERAGVLLSGGETLLVVEDSSLVGQDEAGLALPGLGAVVKGGQMTMSNTHVLDHGGSGVLVASGSGAEVPIVELAGCVVSGTTGNEELGDGWGIQVAGPALVKANQCRVSANESVALGAVGEYSQLTVHNCMVDETVPGPAAGGAGIAALEGAVVEVTESLVSNNVNGGLSSVGTGTTLTVSQTAVQGTYRPEQPGQQGGSFGDGGFAGSGALLRVSDCVIMGNERCGLFFADATGEISSSLVTLNRIYGVAVLGGEEQVGWGEGESTVVGNSTALEPADAAEITYTPGGMALPEQSSPTLPTLAEILPAGDDPPEGPGKVEKTED